MEYAVQILCKFRRPRQTPKHQKLEFYPFFRKPNTISLRDYQLILCMLELQGKIRKLISMKRPFRM